jgi:hypothetical protein
MAITGEVKTIYSDRERTNVLFPRTKTSAVSDNNGRGLDAIIADMQSKIASNILDESLYGVSLPSAAPKGAIFFKKVSG